MKKTFTFAFVIVLAYVVCILKAQEVTDSVTLDLPSPPEPVSIEEDTGEADVLIPFAIPAKTYVQCPIENISISDVTKGRVIIRTYPKDKVTVTDGVSFITRKPYLTLFSETPGKYFFVFILLKDGKLTLIEREFDIK